jgi:hypothetical protein
MASYRICESEIFGDEFVMFCGNYRCSTPSVVEAIQNTEIIIDEIAGVVGYQFSMMTYPRGRFCCGVCGEWKDLDKDNHAWAIRSGQTCQLVCDALVCNDCAEHEEFQGHRFASLAHQDYFEGIRDRATDALVNRMITKWRKAVHVHKERRQFVKMSSLVFKRHLAETSVDWRTVMEAFMVHA